MSFEHVQLSADDYGALERFIKVESKYLERKEFFITDDIVDVLPKILAPGRGVVLSAQVGGQIIGVQAIDFAPNAALINHLCRDHYSPNVWEASWSFVSRMYRGIGIAQGLYQACEEKSIGSNTDVTIVATIHPLNVPSLKLYFSTGFLGISLISHFGLPRVLMVKDERRRYDKIHHPSFTESLDTKSSKLPEKFCKDRILVDVSSESDEITYFYANSDQ